MAPVSAQGDNKSKANQRGQPKGTVLPVFFAEREVTLVQATCRQFTQDVGLTLRKASETLETSHTKVYHALQDE